VSAAVHPACDRTAASCVQPRPHATPKHVATRPGFVLATTILASSLAFVDGSVVNVALPTIGNSLAVGADGLQWVVNAYLLPLSALLLLGGATGDRLGRRRLLVAGTALFALASLGCAVAPELGILLGSRFLQGIGAAMLMPNSLAILGASFSGEAKGRAVGIWAAAAAAAGAAGPVLGGWLIDLSSWRTIFLINLPLAAAAILLALSFVPPDRADTRGHLDMLGGIFAMAGLGALTWALTIGSGHDGWTVGATIGAATSATALLGFVLVERGRGEQAMMPLAMFGSRTFVGLTVLTLLLYGALGGLFVLVPYVLIEARGYTAVAAGAALVPVPLILSATSPFMGGFAGRHGARLLLAAGPAGVAAGFLLTLRIGADGSYWTSVLPALILIAVGVSAAAAPLTMAVLGSVDASHVGSASGLNSAVARTGGLIATALLGSILASQGAALVSGFHTAMVVSSACCATASACALLLVDKI
jgi:EmrB/QacA subfamily drug resistance transporter